MAKKLSDFQTQKRNLNKHRPRAMGMLDNIISKEGWIGAITVANDGETFAGSARLETAQERFGDESEPIVFDIDGTRPVILRRTDIPTADDPRAIRLGIADNRISELNYDPDIELLSAIAEEVDISDMYFEDELAALVEADRNEGEEYLENTDRATNPKEDEEGYLNSSVRQFVLTYSVDEYDLVLGFFELLMNRFNVENNADALKALAESYE